MFPPDLQELVFIWDFEEVFAMYERIPGLPLFGQEPSDPWHYVMDLGYIPGTWFMHRFAVYEFAYMVETDVRYTGHWGNFLNAAMNLAIAGEAPDWTQMPEDVWGPSISADGLASTTLPTRLDGLPDLLNFLPIWRSQKWARSRKNVTADTYDSLMMTWGGSRKLFDTMHEWSRQGKAMFYEAFMPTVAVASNLKMVSVEHPMWLSNRTADQETWHCCKLGARDVYEDWRTSHHCLHASLLHPIKLREPIWQADNLTSSHDVQLADVTHRAEAATPNSQHAQIASLNRQHVDTSNSSLHLYAG